MIALRCLRIKANFRCHRLELVIGPKSESIKNLYLSACHKAEDGPHKASVGESKAARHDTNGKLMYEGKLTNRILYLKSISILSSVGLTSAYVYVIGQKGLTAAMAGLGFLFSPFLLSPVAIAWFFKRYITKLYYDPENDLYTAHHYGWLLSKKRFTYRREDVNWFDESSILNTFVVRKKPFFLHDDDLIDVESVELYKRMLNTDRLKSESSNSGVTSERKY